MTLHFTAILYTFLISSVLCWPTPTNGPLISAYDSIKQVTNLYAIAIDTKDFDLLAQVFSEDAVADFGADSVWTGLSGVQAGLKAA